jgi:hypothetical protein
MTTGDYILWFGALFVLLIMGGMVKEFTKWALAQRDYWTAGVVGAGLLYLCLVAGILTPTYELIVRD